MCKWMIFFHQKDFYSLGSGLFLNLKSGVKILCIYKFYSISWQESPNRLINLLQAG